MDIRSRNYFVRATTNNKTKKGLYTYNFDDIYSQLCSKYDKIAYILHNPNKKDEHAHFIIQSDNPIRFDTIKAIFPFGNIEKQLGSNKQAYDYLTHANDLKKVKYALTDIKTNIINLDEWLLIEKGQGKRNDINSYLIAIKSGLSNQDLQEQYPNQYFRNNRIIEQIRQEQNQQLAKKIRLNLKVSYWSGSTGTGKTRTVYDTYDIDDIYIVNTYDKGSFDNYKGQKIMVFDEYRSSFPLGDLLKYADIYPLQLPARYNNKWALYEHLIIISNIPLNEQYPNLDTKSKEALKRRINDHRQFTFDTITIFDNEMIILKNPYSQKKD